MQIYGKSAEMTCSNMQIYNIIKSKIQLLGFYDLINVILQKKQFDE